MFNHFCLHIKCKSQNTLQQNLNIYININSTFKIIIHGILFLNKILIVYIFSKKFIRPSIYTYYKINYQS